MPQRNDHLLNLTSPWENNDNTVWLASNISLRRNVEKFKFPAKMNVERRKQLIALISKEILSAPILHKPLLLKGEEVGPLEKEFMTEHFLSSENFQQAHVGEAFVIDHSGGFLASLNLKDHIHIQMIDIKREIEPSWNRLVKLENHLGKVIAYSYSPTFGFLTADPAECGTGLHLSIYLQLSALIHMGKLKEVFLKAEDDAVTVNNFLKHEHDALGDLIVLTNHYSLGISEESAMTSVKSLALKIIAAENEVREKIASEESAEIKDKVSRAYGILTHSYQIEPIEALNAIALLKLGVDMKWVSGISIAKLNELFFNCRRAHLMRLSEDKIPQDQIPHKRAEFIHKSLNGIVLNLD